MGNRKTISFTVDEMDYEKIKSYARAKGHGGEKPESNFARYAVFSAMRRHDLCNTYPMPISKSKELYAIRTSRTYYWWRKRVLKRDKYICQKCGHKKNLHVHHILPFAKYPELRFELNNGITLCANCHIEEHREAIKTRNNLPTGSEHYLYLVEA
jgi:hypothetical protein